MPGFAKLAALAAVCTAAAACPGAAPAATAARHLGHAGRFYTDAAGRVVVLHGANIVAKTPPYAPAAFGIGDDDAALLQRVGFDAVRLGVIYTAVEPRPGVYDDAYLRSIARTVAVLHRHGIASLLDFHQDQWNERYEGQGFPDWSMLDDGQPNNHLTFPVGYVANPALRRAADNFWGDVRGPGGVRLQTRYAAAWAHVARRFRTTPGVFGYDLINEPEAGARDECAAAGALTRCRAFETRELAPFYRRVISSVRGVDRSTLIAVEPAVMYDFGQIPSYLPDLHARNVVFSYHPYTGGAARMRAAQRIADRNGGPTLISEGALPENLGAADATMQSWTYWGYWSNKTGPAYTVRNPRRPPTGANLDRRTLNPYVRPYPRVIAGTPRGWSFAARSGRFTLTFAPRRAGGGRLRSSVSELFLPRLVYPHGYRVSLAGARLAPGARVGRTVLRIRTKPGARVVRVVVRRA